MQSVLRWIPLRPSAWVALTVSWLVFAGLVAGFTWRFRAQVRANLLESETAAYLPLTVHQVTLAESLFPSDDPALREANLLTVLLTSADMEEVLAVSLYAPDGKWIESSPVAFEAAGPTSENWNRLHALRAVSYFHPQTPLERFFPAAAGAQNDKPAAGYDLIELLLPVHTRDSAHLLGVAQLLLDGQALAARYATLDRQLTGQAGVAMAAGGVLLTVVLIWAFRRLETVNRQLELRGRRLAQANQELSLAAKTNALGAVTAHLLHGLKNPLSGLQDFVASRAAGAAGNGNGADEDELRLAMESTRRMQEMIQEVAGLLQDTTAGMSYTLTLDEFCGLIERKGRPMAEKHGVRFTCAAVPNGEIDSRQAELSALIVGNLLQNACEATPAGGEVAFIPLASPGEILLKIVDTGPGFPESLRGRLFEIKRSTKPGGSGLGLAISHQLARHLGAELALEKSGPEGSVFTLRLPVAASECAGER